jgi:hypothetical protein
MESALALLRSVPYTLLVAPLRALYFHGPAAMGWGGWAGMPPEDICAAMTQVPASAWASDAAHRTHCADLLDRKFTTVLVAASVAAYAVCLYKLVSYLWLRYVVLRPILAELRACIGGSAQSSSQKRAD